METSTRKLKPIAGGCEPRERFSLRIESGVQIYEHEVVEVCTMRKTSPATSPEDRPRLVVADSDSDGFKSPLLTKSRSDVAGLSNLLGALFNSGQQDCSSV